MVRIAGPALFSPAIRAWPFVRLGSISNHVPPAVHGSAGALESLGDLIEWETFVLQISQKGVIFRGPSYKSLAHSAHPVVCLVYVSLAKNSTENFEVEHVYP